MTLPVTIVEAALGTKVEIPAIDDAVTVKVPSGTKGGRTLRVKGKGGPRPSGGRGDLLVKVDLAVPQKLSKTERELLEEFARLHSDSPRSHLEAWLRDYKQRDRAAS